MWSDMCSLRVLRELGGDRNKEAAGKPVRELPWSPVRGQGVKDGWETVCTIAFCMSNGLGNLVILSNFFKLSQPQFLAKKTMWYYCVRYITKHS